MLTSDESNKLMDLVVKAMQGDMTLSELADAINKIKEKPEEEAAKPPGTITPEATPPGE